MGRSDSNGKQDEPDTAHLGLWFAGDQDGCLARVYLRGCSGDEEGNQFITPDCITEKEFAYWIDWLKAELDLVLEEGRKRFRAASSAGQTRP